MSGEIDFKSKQEKIVAYLDKFDKQIRLPQISPPGEESELNQYLNMDRAVLTKFTAEECSYISYRLAQFALYLQRLNNREAAILNWAEAVHNKAVAGKISSYDSYMKHEIKVALIAQENTYVEAVQMLITECNLKIKSLGYLASSVTTLADYMREIKRAKYIENKVQ